MLKLVDSETKATPQLYTTETISASASASTLRNVLNKFYSKVHGADVTVTTIYYDADSQETASASSAASWKHIVTVNKALDGYSSKTISASPLADKVKKTSATASSITVAHPSTVQMSSPPFNGTFSIVCTDPFNKEYTSLPIDFNANVVTIEKYFQTIPFLVDRVEVDWDYRYKYRENGISFKVIFRDLDYDPPMCHLKPDGEWPLTGNDDMQSNSTVLRPFGESLFFPVVPLEMVRTDAQAP